MTPTSVGLRGAVLAVAAVLLAAGTVAGAAGPGEDLAEGKYRYLSGTGAASPLVARWAGLAAAMPDWKDKNRAAHYRFPPGKDGRKCDQLECHPGFRDAYVEELVALPEGPQRRQARQRRQGLERCGDCHTYSAIREKTASCRLHFLESQRVECTSCHTPGTKVLVPRGEHKTAALRDPVPLRAWPSHELTQDPKQIACDQLCHVKDNPFEVERVCDECHGKGKLELARYTSPQVLVHATEKASLWPRFTDAFFQVLTVGVLAALFLFILLEVVRERKEGRS
ncbi:MAG: hypothetical protein Kow0092_38230 [Deferrisomatales bacterium]